MTKKITEKNIKVYAVADCSPPVKSAAAALAEHLGVELIEDETAADAQREAGLLLVYDESGLSLECGELTMRSDLTSMLPRLKQSNLEHEMLIKAARIKGMAHPRLLDATAGMGEDSLLLAAAAFEVTMYEYDPVIAALLSDALRRAADVPQLAQIVGRMRLVEGDSIAAMREIAENNGPDVILLDPMFPERSKSALIKKKFQLLQQLESPCSDESELLEAAMAVKPRKIVIKRPLKGPYLAGVKPSYSLSGKAIRYDCILCT
jgi:16S rRNA (guanine1516-N2)-methyltransferase